MNVFIFGVMEVVMGFPFSSLDLSPLFECGKGFVNVSVWKGEKHRRV